MAVAESQDGVGRLDVTHSDLPLPLPLLAVVAAGEGVDVGLVFPVVIMLSHGPVDWVVLQLESSEQVHGGAGCWVAVRCGQGGCWRTTGDGDTTAGAFIGRVTGGPAAAVVGAHVGPARGRRW